MIATQELPKYLSVNAFAPESRTRKTVVDRLAMTGWALREAPPEVRPFLAPRSEVDPREWRDERVGFGVILPDRPDLDNSARTTGSDAPEPVRSLIAARDAAVFRFMNGPLAYKYLRDYRHGCDVSIESAPVGMPDDGNRRGFLPRYLLIYGTPDAVPWVLQYIFNARRSVARLHLTGEPLERYVERVLSDWRDAGASTASTVVWSTDHGKDDITHLMRTTLADPLASSFAADDDITSATRLAGRQATGANLTKALAQTSPSMIVTTSHGLTSPLDDPSALAANLGVPVDAAFEPLDPEVLLQTWQPDGAVWYSHACCSAGADSKTAFRGLVPEGSAIEEVLLAVARSGARVAPLPTALLSAKKPARAFIGHVEPTFDWTLRDPQNGQTFGYDLSTALYDNVFRGLPVTTALGEHYARIGSALSAYQNDLKAFNSGDAAVAGLVRSRLVSHDVQSVVTIGDPLAALPLGVSARTRS